MLTSKLSARIRDRLTTDGVGVLVTNVIHPADDRIVLTYWRRDVLRCAVFAISPILSEVTVLHDVEIKRFGHRKETDKALPDVPST